jgi:hypothetical protein
VDSTKDKRLNSGGAQDNQKAVDRMPGPHPGVFWSHRDIATDTSVTLRWKTIYWRVNKYLK